jgi:hypothetical protein
VARLPGKGEGLATDTPSSVTPDSTSMSIFCTSTFVPTAALAWSSTCFLKAGVFREATTRLA